MKNTARDALAEAGIDQAELARRLNVTKAAVSQWFADEGRVPAERCLEIRQATGGKVRCEDLRPDLPWHVVGEGAWDGTERRKAA